MIRHPEGKPGDVARRLVVCPMLQLQQDEDARQRVENFPDPS
jgi:hypothetical protein